MKDLHELTDSELVVALRNGCNDALAVLFERYSRLAFHIARKIVKNEGEAEETVQQVFFDIYRAINQFDPSRATFRTWLLLYANKRAINRRVHLASHKFYDCEELLEHALPTSRFTDVESSCLIKELLATLKPKVRAVIELIYFAGLTPEEISAKTGINVGNVRHRLYRGMAKLRAALNGTSTADECQQSQMHGLQGKGRTAVVSSGRP